MDIIYYLENVKVVLIQTQKHVQMTKQMFVKIQYKEYKIII